MGKGISRIKGAVHMCWKWFLAIGLFVLPLAGCAEDGPDKAPQTAAVSSSPLTLPSPSAPLSAAASPSGSPAASAMASSSPKASPAAAPKASPHISPGPVDPLKPAQAQSQIEARAREAVTALKHQDMAALKGMAHPDRGIRFSPYCYVDTKKDLVFQADQLDRLPADKTVRTWGSYDGSGEPMELTFADFYTKLLYNHDYAKPEKIGYNVFYGKGNTANNIREVYPDSITVEYYFSGFDAKLEGIDWSSLILVFEKKDGTWYVSGIVRNRWTV